VPAWLAGPIGPLAAVAAKAALMYATALLGLRLAHRRTLAQWTAIDFAAAVAVGAVIGRTAVAGSQSYLVGAVALATLLAAHAVVTLARGNRWVGKLVDHRVRVLVAHGRVRRRQLLVCGVTEHDLAAQLRQRGVLDLAGVRYVLYEAKGGLTVVPADAPEDAGLVREGLAAAAGGAGGSGDDDGRGATPGR
jgi:uncharacterized membrane protein YcaP (DUF421 family)